MPGRFFGRAVESRALRDLCLTSFREGTPAVAVLLGEPGSGKSRLLAELSPLIEPGVHISMAGFEPEQSVALAASRGLLERVRDAASGRAVDVLAFGPASDAPVQPVRLFEATHQALSGMGATLLVVDDLHWADDMSVALVHYVVRAAEASREPLVVVLASRPSAVAASVTDSLRRVLSSGRLLEIELDPLGRDDAVQLAMDLNPHLTTDRAGDMWRTAGGSPFWLELLATSEHLDVDVDRFVSDRLRQAGTEGAALLALLALVARPLPVDDVAEIQSWPRRRVERIAATLERGGLVALRMSSLSVAHDLIQQAVLRAMTTTDQARPILRRLSAWLQVSAGDDERRLLEALEYQHRGGGPTLDLATRLVQSPHRLLGVASLGRLAAIADTTDPGDADALCLREGVASLASELGQHEEALRRWSECSSINRDPVGSARASLRASEAALELVRRREAWLHWERARQSAHEDPVLDVETLAQEAALHKFLEHRPSETRAAAGRALSAARDLPASEPGAERVHGRTRRALLRALYVAAEASLFFGDPEEMLALAEELDAAAVGFDDGVHIRALVAGALALRFLGLNDDAEARLRQAWDEVRRNVLPQRTLEVGAAFGNVLVSMGRFDEAGAVAGECLALGRRPARRSSHRAGPALPSARPSGAGDGSGPARSRRRG